MALRNHDENEKHFEENGGVPGVRQAALRGELIAVNAYIKQQRSQIYNLNLHIKTLEKEQSIIK